MLFNQESRKKDFTLPVIFERFEATTTESLTEAEKISTEIINHGYELFSIHTSTSEHGHIYEMIVVFKRKVGS